jgi:rare lipoprotein A
LVAPLGLVLALSAVLLVPTAASASFGQSDRSGGARSRSTWDEEGGSRRVRLARAYYGDTDSWDDDDEARPRRRYRSEDGERRPRYTQRRHKPVAKQQPHRRHVRQHDRRRVAKQSRKTREGTSHQSRKPREVTAHQSRKPPTGPAWTKRSLSTARGPKGSGQHGIASFYWQPQRVAAGGWFNPNAMTAAHRTLPFGTRVKVTHVASGRSVEVKINDRGPYITGRIIDLSRAAAGVIGMTQQGIARVAVEVLGR